MSDLQDSGKSRADLIDRDGTLAVVRASDGSDVGSADAGRLDLFVLVDAAGSITAFHGHVDMGTGIRTALAQIVAEELDVAFARVRMVLGDTSVTPDFGPTIASETIQVTSAPLRRAAAQARLHLVAMAAERLGANTEDLVVSDGLVGFRAGDNRSVSYGELLEGERIRLAFADSVETKPVADYRIVGQSQPRVDLAAKASGGLVYVHDMRVPGMLHGRVVRPPYGGIDAGDFVGTSLISVDESSIAHIPGLVALVMEGDFIGIVAEREEQAEEAMRCLRAQWKPHPAMADLGDLEAALMANPSTPRLLLDKGDVDSALAAARTRITRNYVWPYQLHGSIGPSAALAQFESGRLRVWSGTQNPVPMRADLAVLLGIPESAVDVVRMEAAGCYGRNGADDVTADAALLSRAVGKPVRVQLTRDQEHVWEPKGAAQLMSVDGGIDEAGDVTAYDFSCRYPSNAAPSLALLLTGRVSNKAAVIQMGDRTAIGPYEYANHRVVCHDMAPIARAAWLRGVSAMPNTFAHESFIDEAAFAAGVDPVEYRLRYLKDPRASDLVRQLAERAEWEAHTAPRMERDENGVLHGRGFAYALYVHSKFPGYGAAWSAWVADVAVDPSTGDVSVTKVTVGQDSGLMINPDGVKHQIHGNVIQSVSRVTREEVTFSEIGVTSRDWGGYPLLTMPEMPSIDVMMVPRPNEDPLGVGESASVPSAAAIANAIFDATGVRFRELPFTPDRILKGLREAGVATAPEPAALAPPAARARPKKPWLIPLAAAALGAIGSLGVQTLPFRPALSPIARPDASLYSAQTIARGQMLAKLGACFTCHTVEDGAPLAGGLAIETPFGNVYSTNITPDVATGIGAWSFEAFARAMREGVRQNGQHLYPAFPYTSFARTSDSDLHALYAFLMAQPAVAQANKSNDLRFPFSMRPLMALWNTMFHKATTFTPDAARSVLWNRGAYLVEGLGHCSACHSPRNALGAEESGKFHLVGGMVDGWAAPALNALSRAPIAWDETAFYDYLRTGFSPAHGAAAGPMGPVVAELKDLPDDDIRAMAHYLASLGPQTVASTDTAAAVAKLDAAASVRARMPASYVGARIFDGACAVCHEQGRGPTLFGVKPSLAVNTAVHSDEADTLVRVILEGIRVPGLGELGVMPSFQHHLDDAQITELATYIRARFAPDKEAWADLSGTVGRIRARPSLDSVRSRADH
ncbi:MAG: Isoquinoline 1oxidoreductase beta subunit [Hyphomicrobiales bacterium]|nr:Isoquinoline 1oxidoreductase beta subunit [Hyphomicrobiales bacterium]